jgi:hypothetical protein
MRNRRVGIFLGPSVRRVSQTEFFSLSGHDRCIPFEPKKNKIIIHFCEFRNKFSCLKFFLNLPTNLLLFVSTHEFRSSEFQTSKFQDFVDAKSKFRSSIQKSCQGLPAMKSVSLTQTEVLGVVERCLEGSR